MQIVLNSKFFADRPVAELGARALELGYDGIDVCVRPEHPVHPGNAGAELPGAVDLWRRQGLSCPLATAPTDFVDPAAPGAEGLYAACAEAGVPRLKIGFWRFASGADYWQAVDAARRDLEGFAGLSEKHGVQTCYQAHSGACLGSNCAGLMHLIRGFDPRLVGAYPDLGHQALDGEDWEMGLAMVRAHLSVVGVKDAMYRREQERRPPWNPCFVKVGDGCVDWGRCLGILRGFGFEGPLTVHTEYSFDEAIIRQVGYAESAPPNLEEWARADAAWLRRALAALPPDGNGSR